MKFSVVKRVSLPSVLRKEWTLKNSALLVLRRYTVMSTFSAQWLKA